MIRVATFYRFVPIEDPARLRDDIERSARAQRLLGTVLIAREGVNGTLAGEAAPLAGWLEAFASDPRFARLRPSSTMCASAPFRYLKVKVRDELVAMRWLGAAAGSGGAALRAGSNRAIERENRVLAIAPTSSGGVIERENRALEIAPTSTHVNAQQWNRLLDDPDVLVLDVRNRYEIDVGAFPRAVDPGTRSFHEFPAFADTLHPQRPVAMYCTGGIRCEKASALLLSRGFRSVFQLDGGILRYLDEADPDNRFEGECFLFDQRVAVDRSLDVGSFVTCHACRHPLSVAARQSPLFKEGESCPHCHDMLTDAQRIGFAERRRQTLAAESVRRWS